MATDILTEVLSHYQAWTKDNRKRATRKFGWNDITDAYYGKLPDDWPFMSKTVDPRIRTSIVEKNSRLINGRLKGRLIPREDGDVLSAQIQNAVLDFQWDNAQDGGSMTTKIGICDLDTRLYASKFGLVKWRYEVDNEGECVFDGNEFTPLDIRDCGMDFGATHIKDAKWFQVRTWEYLEDLENQSDVDGEAVFKNINVIKEKIAEKLNGQSSRRSTDRPSRIQQIKGLEDRVGTDIAYPVVEIVTEYRKDKWITFAPNYDIILREIENPYDHKKIPVAQLRYYALQDDALGESEVEPVIPLWRAIQATICGYMDEVILKMRPPLKIVEGAARIETIVYGPEAQWLVSRPDAVTEMQSNGEATRYFQTTYSALISAFNTAMGDLSQGTSGVDPFNPQKTATEINASVKQQNSKDQKNQNDLAEFIKDIMSMWMANNKQFLFTAEKKEVVIRIIGQDKFNYFVRAGLDRMELTNEATQAISDIIQQNPNLSDGQIMELVNAGSVPKYPVVENPEEKNPDNLKIKPKMKLSEMGDSAEVSVIPDDLNGTYDYVADVKSMGAGAGQELLQGREYAIGLLTSNEKVLQLLASEGYKPKVKELLSADFEDRGLNDAERFFEKIDANQINSPTGGLPQGGAPQAPGISQPMQNQGVPGISQANPSLSPTEQMA